MRVTGIHANLPVADIAEARDFYTGYLGLSGAVNAVGHTVGRRPNDNSATNGWFLALLTCGEGLHNNHHDRPTSPRFSRRWSQIDLAWWGIRFLTWCKLVRLRTIRVGQTR